MAQQVTPRQLQLLKAIACFRNSRCYSPTIGELASELGTSRSTAFEHIAELRRKGFLSGRAGRARSLRLTSRAQELLSGLGQADGDSTRSCEPAIAVLGRVAAGEPIEAVEDREELSIDSLFGPAEEIFALQVTGQSMVEAGIEDGDYVICRRSAVANQGQLVIAVLDDENATLKRFYKEPGRVRLEPANDAYKPIYSDNCRIEAVVVGLIRRTCT